MIENKELNSLIEKKYLEMKEKNILEDFLGKDKWGGLEVFINEKPKYVLVSFLIDPDTVYLGSQSI